MNNVKLIRFDKGDQGTFGKILYNGFTKFTGELPDRNNQSGVSCIPIGSYQVKWTLSPRFKRYMYEVLNVPNRGGIRMHSANFMGDSIKGYKVQLLGCIALGERIGYLNGQKALLVSKPAMTHFELAMNKQPFLLEIS